MKEGMDIDGDSAGEENFGSCLSSLVDTGSIESHRYYLARKTVLEMLRDRGFAVPNCEIEVSLEDFRAKHGQNPDVDGLRISSLHKDDPSIKVTQFPSFLSLLPLFRAGVYRIILQHAMTNSIEVLLDSTVLSL